MYESYRYLNVHLIFNHTLYMYMYVPSLCKQREKKDKIHQSSHTTPSNTCTHKASNPQHFTVTTNEITLCTQRFCQDHEHKDMFHPCCIYLNNYYKWHTTIISDIQQLLTAWPAKFVEEYAVLFAFVFILVSCIPCIPFTFLHYMTTMQYTVQGNNKKKHK